MVTINYAAYRAQIERLYTDVVNIYRYEKTRNPNTGVSEQKTVLKYSDQPCRISQRSLATNAQTDAQNSIQYETKLFIAPEVDIMQGDLLEVTRGGVTRKYNAGEPFLYPTHQEVSIQRREWA